MSVVKRFIAGAVCPRCGEMDTLRMFRQDGQIHRDCVRCGYEDDMSAQGEPQVDELETRVNKDELKITESQPLNFHPNPGLKRRDH